MADAPLVVVDAGLVESGVVTTDQVRRRFAGSAAEVVTARGNDIDEVAGLARRDPASFHAVGGGAVIDTVKLAALVASSHLDLRRLWDADAPPYLLVEPSPRGRPMIPVFANATTLGTGAEASDKVSARLPGGRLTLVQSRLLKPVWGRVDLDLVRHLDVRAVELGLGEVLFRLLGPMIESRRTDSDRQLLAMARLLLDAIRRREWESPDSRPHALAGVASVGAWLHSPGVFAGGSRFIGRPWYLGRTVQELYPEVAKVEAIYDAWLRWAHVIEASGEELMRERWRGIALSLGLNTNVHQFVTRMRDTLRLTFDFGDQYPDGVKKIPALTESRWGALLSLDSGERSCLIEAYHR